MMGNGISLVTGAAGFMGSHVVETLAAKGARVRATSRARKDTSFFDQLGVEFIPSDLTDPTSLKRLFDGPVDRVFHLGAICNFSTPYDQLVPTNVDGVDRLTELALEKGVRRFVHVTSTSVYGYGTGNSFTERDTPRPQDDYAKSKRAGEGVVLEKLGRGLPAVIVRPPTVYGPRCNDGAGKVFSRPSPITAVPGSGRQRLSNVRAEDVALALDHLAGLEHAVGEIYNVADDSHPSLKEALVLAARTFGTAPPRLHLPLVLIRWLARLDGYLCRRKGSIPDLESDAVNYLYADYCVDNTKLKETGFGFQYPDFTQSMQQLGAWFQQQKVGKGEALTAS